MNMSFEIILKKDFNDSHRDILAKMLEKQGKVRGDLNEKIARCEMICIGKVDDEEVAIGAIKEKTASDFSLDKAGLPDLSDDFEWELGYFYTCESFTRKGMASTIAKLLITEYGNENLMASTEITANPSMVNILHKNGFRLFGKPWKSEIHDNHLGLFLKFKNQE